MIISVKLLERVSTILYVDGVDVGVIVTLLLRRKRKLSVLMPTVSTGRTITLRLMSSIHSALAQTLNLIFAIFTCAIYYGATDTLMSTIFE